MNELKYLLCLFDWRKAACWAVMAFVLGFIWGMGFAGFYYGWKQWG